MSSDLYNKYVKTFNEQHVPVVARVNAAYRRGDVPDPEDIKQMDHVSALLDSMDGQLTPRERELMGWWGIRANAVDFLQSINNIKTRFLTKGMTPEETDATLQELLEQFGWIEAVLKLEYLSRSGPVEGWTQPKPTPCTNCNRSEKRE